MKRIAMLCVALIVALVGMAACTENQMAKSMGGTMTVDLPAGQKLMTATWKNDELWYLYQPRSAGEVPVTSILQEDSSLGLVQGKVIFKEK